MSLLKRHRPNKGDKEFLKEFVQLMEKALTARRGKMKRIKK